MGHGYKVWNKDELKNLAGLNLIRVFKDVERVRDAMKNDKIIDDFVPYTDIVNENPEVIACRTDTDKYKHISKKSKLISSFYEMEENL